MSQPPVQEIGRKCEICFSPLPSTVPGDRPEISRLKLYNGKSALEASAEWGCRICSCLWQTFSKHYGADLDTHMCIEMSPDLDSFRIIPEVFDAKGLVGGQWDIVVSPRNSTTVIKKAKSGQSLTNNAEEEKGKELPPARPLACGRAGCRWCEIAPRRYQHPTGFTGSAGAIDAIRGWLSRCIQEHTGCGGDQKYPLPKRVLEIVDHKSAEVRLVVTDGRQEDKYACLSHRWCADTEKASLKSKDVEGFQQAVPQQRLYALLRDAIWAAGELGLKYIWIDCMVSFFV